MRYAGVRLGEADHPGPVISMPGDGSCTFHALGYWAKQDQDVVRHTVAKHGVEHWDKLFPWDTGEEYADFLHTAKTPGAWGDGRHLAIASQVYKVRIKVVGDRPYWFGNEGAVWTIRFDARLEYYDVVVPREERKPPRPAGVPRTDARDLQQAAQVHAAEPGRLHRDTHSRQAEKPARQRSHLGSTRAHLVMAINVGGSR